jgi:hypothetical protein
MSCDYCKRTFRGFIWMVWGYVWWPLTLHFAVPRYLRQYDNNSKHDRLTEWLLGMYGNIRNPEWSTRHERKTCVCKKSKQKL